MDQPLFSDSQFLDQNALNAAFGLGYTSAQQVTDLTNSPGLINPASLTITPSALNITVAAPAPFAVLFGSGALAGAHGTANGADTSTYTVSMSALVPTTGSVTAYVVASFTQIQETPYEVVGPPAGHPDYNPSFAAYTAYAETRDSLAIVGTLTDPDNLTTFELCRTTLTAAQTSITTVDMTHWLYASSLLNPTGVTAGTYTGATVTVGADGRITSLGGVAYALQSALTAEITRAEGQESTLQTNINTEATTRASADTTLQTNIAAETTARITAVQQQSTNYAPDTGTTNALAITLSPAPTALTAGLTIRVKAANLNTAASTINVNGLGAVAIVNQGGTSLAYGQIPVGGVFEAIYDGTHFELVGGAQAYSAINLTASTVLTSADFGVLIETPTAGITVTMPVAANSLGQTIRIYNNSTGYVTLAAGNFNSAYGSAVASIQLPPNTTAEFVADLVSWNALGGSASVGTPPMPHGATGVPGDFVSINAANSYALPTGGSWLVAVQFFNGSNASSAGSSCGILAGGTTVLNTSGLDAQGFAWRIQ